MSPLWRQSGLIVRPPRCSAPPRPSAFWAPFPEEKAKCRYNRCMAGDRSFSFSFGEASSAIAFEDVRIGFDEGEILRGVSFCVRERETVVLLGETGTGKTLTLKMAAGLLRPDRDRKSTRLNSSHVEISYA